MAQGAFRQKYKDRKNCIAKVRRGLWEQQRPFGGRRGGRESFGQGEKRPIVGGRFQQGGGKKKRLPQREKKKKGYGMGLKTLCAGKPRRHSAAETVRKN